jgi:AcrR family transcriptional regulator
MVMRATRTERKARTREELLHAARRVFLERGFHGASLDDIADEAGYTKGAVYSNFTDKDALFLAVLDEHYARRIAAYRTIMLAGTSLDETYRDVSRFLATADEREPDWLPLLAEFTAHAGRREWLRRSWIEIRQRFLDAVAEIIDSIGQRHGSTLRVSSLEAARASSLLARGYSADRRLDPDAYPTELFVELHTALLYGLTVPADGERR